jgi:alkylation response protein AidB-like acyl-CoA dehydrogenase
MDISFNEDQVEIANQARRFVENECPSSFVLEMYEDERGITDELWSKMAEMGWMGMRIPEEYGGIGLGLADLCIVLEEMGRGVLPGPFFATVMLAAESVIEAGNESQKQTYLPKIAGGEIRGTLALLEPDGGPNPDYVQMEARHANDGFILNGTKLFVPDAQVADFMVVAARTEPGDDPDRGITLFLVDTKVDGISITSFVTMDGSRKQSRVDFKDVSVAEDDVLGEVNKGWEPLSRVLRYAAVGLTAENVGGAEKAMEIAVDYAKIRIAFGQPIGGYQAIKHQCSEMLVDVESSRSLQYYAAWAQEEEDSVSAALAAHSAKSESSKAYVAVTAKCLQVMGAIGITWEHDAHLYYKRANANEVAFGDTAYHREEIARLIGY